ncbi:argonaute family protein [Striga asiatica]|uniref:Argonaute family protein n=1 Tax=Striga asiatica TaxID=4170 RepID=A0A5A7PWF1_STRAF|nr:argonaute family protein [Striga asiatica]
MIHDVVVTTRCCNHRRVTAIFNLSRRTEWFSPRLETMGRQIADLSMEIGDICLTIRTIVRDKQTYRDAVNRGVCEGIRGGGGGRGPGGAPRQGSPQPLSGDDDDDGRDMQRRGPNFVDDDDQREDRGKRKEAAFVSGYRARCDWDLNMMFSGGLDCQCGRWEGPFRVDILDLDGEQHDGPFYDGPPIFDEEPPGPGEELDGKHFSYDGEKSLFTVSLLPQNKLEFTFLLDSVTSSRNNGNSSLGGQEGSNETKIPIQAITHALRGQESKNSHEAIRVLDIILRQHGAKARLREKSCRDQTFTLKCGERHSIFVIDRGKRRAILVMMTSLMGTGRIRGRILLNRKRMV